MNTIRLDMNTDKKGHRVLDGEYIGETGIKLTSDSFELVLMNCEVTRIKNKLTYKNNYFIIIIEDEEK
jgi:hypothetical protein